MLCCQFDKLQYGFCLWPTLDSQRDYPVALNRAAPGVSSLSRRKTPDEPARANLPLPLIAIQAHLIDRRNSPAAESLNEEASKHHVSEMLTRCRNGWKTQTASRFQGIFQFSSHSIGACASSPYHRRKHGPPARKLNSNLTARMQGLGSTLLY